jgi:hypothetical protein
MNRKVLRAFGLCVHDGLNPRALGAFPEDGYRRDSSRYRGPRLRLRMRRVVHDNGPRVLLVRWRVDDELLRRFFVGHGEGVEHALRATLQADGASAALSASLSSAAKIPFPAAGCDLKAISARRDWKSETTSLSGEDQTSGARRARHDAISVEQRRYFLVV